MPVTALFRRIKSNVAPKLVFNRTPLDRKLESIGEELEIVRAERDLLLDKIASTEEHDDAAPTQIPAEFDPDEYLLANPDVAASGMDALTHYVEHGQQEGRRLMVRRVDRLDVFTKEFQSLCEIYASQLKVSPAIHSDDHMMTFIRKMADDDATAVDEYFMHGRGAADMLSRLISQYPGTSSVLEFASGYGRVTRHLKQVAPQAHITACDIHPEANSFVRDSIGVHAIESTSAPEDFVSDKAYDMAFALSLFSHLPESTWTKWVRALLASVRVGGVVAFTTHGRITAREQEIDLTQRGFLFKGVSEQDDLDAAEYGTTYITSKCAFEKINSLGNARIVDFIEGYWGRHQDLYVIQRSS